MRALEQEQIEALKINVFEDTWIECLGDLGRYRRAIEDEDIRDREIWTDASRYWYSKASDKTPITRRYGGTHQARVANTWNQGYTVMVAPEIVPGVGHEIAG